MIDYGGNTLMGLLSMLSGKKTVTPAIYNEMKREMEHMRTVVRKVNTTDSIKTYFDSYDEMLRTYQRIGKLDDGYDWKHGKYALTGSVKKSLQDNLNAKAADEKAFIGRAYEKLERECVKLATEAGKEKKRSRFFTELEYYYNRMEKSTIGYIESLKRT